MFPETSMPRQQLAHIVVFVSPDYMRRGEADSFFDEKDFDLASCDHVPQPDPTEKKVLKQAALIFGANSILASGAEY